MDTGIVKPIKTIANPSESRYKEKNSEFIGQLYPVSGEEEINLILRNTRKKYYDAVHNCFAWRLKDNSFRYSDDGEPNGTAGIRILNAIDHHNLTDVLLIITRYFGGVKLGVGPLGKAYYSTAEQVISISRVVEKKPFSAYRMVVPFLYTNQLYHITGKYNARISTVEYSDIPEFDCLLPFEFIDEIIIQLKVHSNDQIKIKSLDKIIFL